MPPSGNAGGRELQLSSSDWNAEILIGTRYQFPDKTAISLEYLYQSDGYTPSQFRDAVNGLSLFPSAASPPATANSGMPQEFTFIPVEKHYLFFTVTRPKIMEDFTVGGALIANLQDLSAVASGSFAWNVTDHFTLSVAGYLPFLLEGETLGATVPRGPNAGSSVGELTLSPLRYRAVLDLRVFY